MTLGQAAEEENPGGLLLLDDIDLAGLEDIDVALGGSALADALLSGMAFDAAGCSARPGAGAGHQGAGGGWHVPAPGPPAAPHGPQIPFAAPPSFTTSPFAGTLAEGLFGPGPSGPATAGPARKRAGGVRFAQQQQPAMTGRKPRGNKRATTGEPEPNSGGGDGDGGDSDTQKRLDWRRRRSEAQQRWREGRRTAAAALEASIAQKYEEVVQLLEHQATLRAKERALSRALTGILAQMGAMAQRTPSATHAGAPSPASSDPSSVAGGQQTGPQQTDPAPASATSTTRQPSPLATSSWPAATAAAAEGPFTASHAAAASPMAGTAPSMGAPFAPAFGNAPTPTWPPAAATQPALAPAPAAPGCSGAFPAQPPHPIAATAAAAAAPCGDARIVDIWDCRDLRDVLPSGDPVFEEIIGRLDPLHPLQEFPPDLVASLSLRYQDMIEGLRTAAANRPIYELDISNLSAGTLRLSMDFNIYLRKAMFLHPLLRMQLRHVNLMTTAREDPPPDLWHRVARDSGAYAFVEEHPEAAHDLRAQLALRAEQMDKLHARQGELVGLLQALWPEHSVAGANAGAAAGDDILLASERQALLEELELVMVSQLRQQNVMISGIRKLFPLRIILRIMLLACPWWPDWQTIIEAWAENHPA